MFDILSDEELGQVYELCAETADCPFGVEDADCDLCIKRLSARVEQKHTLKQVYDWGNEPCKNGAHAMSHYFYVKHGYYCHQRDCHNCWQELQKEVTNV